tara:strand:- start:822 stop:1421 length:600 start_codon:yes stop_codon:yes gene_type:complete
MPLDDFSQLLEHSIDNIIRFRDNFHPDFPFVTYMNAAKGGFLDKDPTFDPSFRAHMLRADENLARQLFELAMLRGNPKYWCDARILDPEIVPTANYALHGIMQAKFLNFTQLNFPVQNSEDEVEWQQWRHRSLVTEEFTEDSFANYQAMRLKEDLLYANQSLAFADEIELTNRKVQIASPPKPQEASSQFRFRYATWRL